MCHVVLMRNLNFVLLSAVLYLVLFYYLFFFFFSSILCFLSFSLSLFHHSPPSFMFLFHAVLLETGVTAETGVGFTATILPETTGKYKFTDMLTPEFYQLLKINGTINPADFRKDSKAQLVPTSGKFFPCKLHKDCLNYREPEEWCRPESAFEWT